MPSCSMTKSTAPPPLPQPKQCQTSFEGVTTNEGVFSLWNGQHALKLVPCFFKSTKSDTTSNTLARSITWSIVVLSIMSCLFCYYRMLFASMKIPLSSNSHIRLKSSLSPTMTTSVRPLHLALHGCHAFTPPSQVKLSVSVIQVAVETPRYDFSCINVKGLGLSA